MKHALMLKSPYGRFDEAGCCPTGSSYIGANSSRMHILWCSLCMKVDSGVLVTYVVMLQDPMRWTGVAGRAPTAEICLPDVRNALAGGRS